MDLNAKPVVITPEPGAEKWVAQLLLSLADSPYEVSTRAWPTFGFVVGQDLFERFEAAAGAEHDVSVAEPGASASLPNGSNAAVTSGTAVNVARKRGRPKKNPE